MPAKDRYHDTVRHALIKDGWSIVEEQAKLKVGSRRLWIDFRIAKQEDQLAVLVEVKGFENSPSLVEELSDSVGQYIIYMAVLTAMNIQMPLYMAIPTTAFEGILREEIGQQVREYTGLKLLVFDPLEEEVKQWIPSLDK